jgi:hypothetical protein
MTTSTRTRADIMDDLYECYREDTPYMTMDTYITFDRWLRLYKKDYEAMAQRMARIRGDYDG